MLDLIASVSKLLREASETCVLSVFGQLEANAKEKSPGEWVTAADKASEAFLEPVTNQLAIAEQGSGSWINDHKITVTEDSPDLNLMNGAALRRFLPATIANRIDDVQGRFANFSEGSKCAGFDYPAVSIRVMDFVLYWRTLPWDHAAGVLFIQEAGGHAARIDGSEYLVADHSKSGLLVAHNIETWLKVNATLFD